MQLFLVLQRRYTEGLPEAADEMGATGKTGGVTDFRNGKTPNQQIFAVSQPTGFQIVLWCDLQVFPEPPGQGGCADKKMIGNVADSVDVREGMVDIGKDFLKFFRKRRGNTDQLRLRRAVEHSQKVVNPGGAFDFVAFRFRLMEPLNDLHQPGTV